MASHFMWLDYVLFIAIFLVGLGIGLYHAFSEGGQKSTGKYFMGDRDLSLIPVTLSILVSLVSANTLLGVPAEIYGFGIHMLLRSGSIVISVAAGAFLFVPLFHPLKVTSVQEYLELRFKSRLVRILGTVLLLITQILYVGCVIFGPAIALETATGIPPWASILMVSVVGTTYTALGGMKAVIYTDVFQSVVIVAGMLTIIILGTQKVGGFDQVWKINQEWDRLHVSFNPDPTERVTFWVFFVGYAVYWSGSFGVNQPSVQRYCAMSSMKKAQISVLLNGPGFAILNAVSAFAGLVAFAFYTTKGCDPLQSGQITNSNQLLPYFVMEVLNYPGLPGLFIACLFSGSLSTLSSSINSLSAVVWEDILKPHLHHIPETRKAFISKILAVFFGGLCMGVAFMVWSIGGNLIQVGSSFFGAAMGPLLGLYVLGALFPWANWIGAFTGGACAMTFNLWIMMGQILHKTQFSRLPAPTYGCFPPGNGTAAWPVTDASVYNLTQTTATLPGPEDDVLHPVLRWLYKISFGYYPVIGVILTLSIGICVSLASGRTDPSTVESRFYFTFLRGKYGCKSEEGTEEEKKHALEDMNKNNETIGFGPEEKIHSVTAY